MLNLLTFVALYDKLKKINMGGDNIEKIHNNVVYNMHFFNKSIRI